MLCGSCGQLFEGTRETCPYCKRDTRPENSVVCQCGAVVLNGKCANPERHKGGNVSANMIWQAEEDISQAEVGRAATHFSKKYGRWPTFVLVNDEDLPQSGLPETVFDTIEVRSSKLVGRDSLRLGPIPLE